MKLLLIFIFAFLFTACTSNNLDLDSKISSWESKLENEIPVGSNKNQILEWFQKNSINISSGNNDSEITASLEQIKDSSPVCSHWTIYLSIELDQGKSKRNNVEKIGTCL